MSRYRHPDDKKIVVCALTAFLCLAAFAASLLRICLAEGAPPILALVLFISATGFCISLSFLVKFLSARARDKKNGVTVFSPETRKKPTAAEIVSIVAIALSGIAVLVAVVLICYPQIAPQKVTFGLLIGGCKTYNASGAWARHLNRRSLIKAAEETQNKVTAESEENVVDGEATDGKTLAEPFGRDDAPDKN